MTPATDFADQELVETLATLSRRFRFRGDVGRLTTEGDLHVSVLPRRNPTGEATLILAVVTPAYLRARLVGTTYEVIRCSDEAVAEVGHLSTRLRAVLRQCEANQEYGLRLTLAGPQKISATLKISELIHLLRDADGSVRRSAAESLAKMGPTLVDALPQVVQLLADADVHVCEAAARAVGSLGPAAVDALPQLVRLLAHAKPDVRLAAAEAVGSLGPAAVHALPQLIQLFTDTSERVREAAAKAVGSLGPSARDAVGPLIQLLSNPDRGVRGSAAEALGKIGPDAVAPLVGLLGDDDRGVRARAAEALGKIGPAARDAVAPLITLLSDTDSDVRKSVADALVTIGPSAAVIQPLIALLNDPEWEIRAISAERLGFLGFQAAEARPHLCRLLEDRYHLKVRVAALQALCEMGPTPEEAPTLFEIGLADPHPHVRCLAAECLEQLPTLACLPAVPTLKALLSDPDEEVRIHCARLLGRLGDYRALEELLKALEDREPEVRMAVAESLGAFALGRARVRAALERLRRDPEVEVRECIRELLERSAPVVVIDTTSRWQVGGLPLQFSAAAAPGDAKEPHVLRDPDSNEEIGEIFWKHRLTFLRFRLPAASVEGCPLLRVVFSHRSQKTEVGRCFVGLIAEGTQAVGMITLDLIDEENCPRPVVKQLEECVLIPRAMRSEELAPEDVPVLQRSLEASVHYPAHRAPLEAALAALKTD